MKTAKALEIEVREEMTEEKEAFAKDQIRQILIKTDKSRKCYYQDIEERDRLLRMTVEQIYEEKEDKVSPAVWSACYEKSSSESMGQ